MEKSIDFYLDHPLIVDFIIIILLVLGQQFCPLRILFKFDVIAQTAILSNLIGTSVSLAGFILAALTIIVSFKSNIACKKPENAKNPLELIFSDRKSVV